MCGHVDDHCGEQNAKHYTALRREMHLPNETVVLLCYPSAHDVAHASKSQQERLSPRLVSSGVLATHKPHSRPRRSPHHHTTPSVGKSSPNHARAATATTDRHVCRGHQWQRGNAAGALRHHGRCVTHACVCCLLLLVGGDLLLVAGLCFVCAGRAVGGGEKGDRSTVHQLCGSQRQQSRYMCVCVCVLCCAPARPPC